jgi:iron complex outermembrane recepter protein
MLIQGFEAEADSLKHYYLHPVRVVAESEKASISSIKRILNPPNSIPVSEAMGYSPGLSISYGSRDESNLRIRGFRKNEALILLDGRPLNSGYFGNVDLSKILIDDVAEIRIIKGPASAMYGSGTMGGVINIVTGHKEHLINLENSLSRNLSNSQRISSAFSWGDFRYQASLMREEKRPFALAGDFEPTVFENGKLRDHFYQSSWHLNLKLGHILNQLHDMELGGTYSWMPYKSIASSIYSRDYRVYRDWYRASASYAGDFATSINTSVKGLIYLDAAGDTFERYLDEAHNDLSLSSRMESINLGLSPTLEYRSSGTFSTGSRIEYRTVKRKDTGNYMDWTQNHAVAGSVFGQYESRLTDRLSYTISAAAAFFTHSQNSRVELFPEPSAGIYYTFADGSSSSISAGFNSALPTMRQLFSADHGNPSLKASQALKIELNHQQILTKSLFADLSLYYNDVHDLIDQLRERYENIYQVKSFGTELSLGAKPLHFWEFSTAYSYLDYTGNYRLSDSPPQTLEIINRFTLPLNLGLKLKSMWCSRRDSQDSIAQFHSLPAYHTHDVSISCDWDKIHLGIGLQNIFDHNYQSEYGYPAKGRDYLIKLAYTLP